MVELQNQRVGENRGQAGRPGQGDDHAKQSGTEKTGGFPFVPIRPPGRANAFPMENIRRPQPKDNHQRACHQVQRAAVQLLEESADQPRAGSEQREQRDEARQQAQAALEHPAPGRAPVRFLRAFSHQVEGVYGKHRQHAGGEKRDQPAAEQRPEGERSRGCGKGCAHWNFRGEAPPLASTAPTGPFPLPLPLPEGLAAGAAVPSGRRPTPSPVM